MVNRVIDKSVEFFNKQLMGFDAHPITKKVGKKQ